MNMKLWSQDSEDELRDARVGAWLGELDPGRDDPSYWMGFHNRVGEANRLELMRRRRESERSVAGVVSGWSRIVVPAALVAAAVAGLVLARPIAESPVALEDMITMGASEPVPFELVDDETDEAWLVLASEGY
jgi:hypothetical protein